MKHDLPSLLVESRALRDGLAMICNRNPQIREVYQRFHRFHAALDRYSKELKNAPCGAQQEADADAHSSSEDS